jgi:hypothetical protein
MRTNRWRDTMRITGAFRKSAKAPKSKFPTSAVSSKGVRIYCFGRLHIEFEKIVLRVFEL